MTNTWSGPRPYIERSAALAELKRQVDAGLIQGGRAAFLLGPAGAGVTHCLGILQEEAYRAHRGLKAEYVNCAESDENTWMEIAELFTGGHRLKRSAQRVAVEWAEAVPIAGKLLQAIGKTIVILRGVQSEERKVRPPASGAQSAIEAVRALLEFGTQEPRLIIMDSLDRGDAEDLAGARALFRKISETRTLFVAGVRTEERGRPPGAVGDLILEAERLGIARRVELEPLERWQLGDAVGAALSSELPAEWLDWLLARSGGHPGTLWSTLGRLEDSGALAREGRGWRLLGEPPDAPDPEDDGAPYPFASLLSPEDRRLLGLAALEGTQFRSAVLAQLADLDELQLEDTLARLAREGVIEYRDAPAWGDELTSLYAFRRAGDARAFARALSDPEREAANSRLAELRAGPGQG